MVAVEVGPGRVDDTGRGRGDVDPLLVGVPDRGRPAGDRDAVVLLDGDVRGTNEITVDQIHRAIGIHSDDQTDVVGVGQARGAKITLRVEDDGIADGRVVAVGDQDIANLSTPGVETAGAGREGSQIDGDARGLPVPLGKVGTPLLVAVQNVVDGIRSAAGGGDAGVGQGRERVAVPGKVRAGRVVADADLQLGVLGNGRGAGRRGRLAGGVGGPGAVGRVVESPQQPDASGDDVATRERQAAGSGHGPVAVVGTGEDPDASTVFKTVCLDGGGGGGRKKTGRRPPEMGTSVKAEVVRSFSQVADRTGGHVVECGQRNRERPHQ